MWSGKWYHLNYDLEGEEAKRDAQPSGLTMLGATACCGGRERRVRTTRPRRVRPAMSTVSRGAERSSE